MAFFFFDFFVFAFFARGGGGGGGGVASTVLELRWREHSSEQSIAAEGTKKLEESTAQ